MRSAVVLCGNLRTFLMPHRKTKIKLIESFINNIIVPNNSDIFICCDTNDFYHNDVQYFSTDKKIEILNNYTCRLHQKIDFIEFEKAKSLILSEFNILQPYLKDIIIEPPFDINQDYKFKELNYFKINGNNPALLIHQLRKLKLAYNLLENYELKNNIKYDSILKWRFDNTSNEKFDFKSYDLNKFDVYVPGIHSPVIYDFYALGHRKAMELFFSLYDIAGDFLPEGRVYICSRCKYYGSNSEHKCTEDNELYEISLSVEYHLFKVFQKNNIKLCNASYPSAPYRYNDESLSIENFMKNLNIDATVVTYNPGNGYYEKSYSKKE
jgi:hypothetical protein